MEFRIVTLALALTASALLCTPDAQASTLTGASIYGTITVGSGIQVLQQFHSPATIGAGTEFNGSFDLTSFPIPFYVSADFGSDDLTVVFTAQNPGAGLINYNYQTLVDLAFQGLPPTFGGFDSFEYSCNSMLGTACGASSNGYYQGTLSGNELTYDFKSVFSGDTYRFYNAPLTPTPSAVPEPSSFALLGTGLLASFTAVRRRLKGN